VLNVEVLKPNKSTLMKLSIVSKSCQLKAPSSQAP